MIILGPRERLRPSCRLTATPPARFVAKDVKRARRRATMDDAGQQRSFLCDRGHRVAARRQNACGCGCGYHA